MGHLFARAAVHEAQYLPAICFLRSGCAYIKDTCIHRCMQTCIHTHHTLHNIIMLYFHSSFIEAKYVCVITAIHCFIGTCNTLTYIFEYTPLQRLRTAGVHEVSLVQGVHEGCVGRRSQGACLGSLQAWLYSDFTVASLPDVIGIAGYILQ